jgi:hypothetical protein
MQWIIGPIERRQPSVVKPMQPFPLGELNSGFFRRKLLNARN